VPCTCGYFFYFYFLKNLTLLNFFSKTNKHVRLRLSVKSVKNSQVFFSLNKSANSTYNHGFSNKQISSTILAARMHDGAAKPHYHVMHGGTTRLPRGSQLSADSLTWPQFRKFVFFSYPLG
jgi:hypothetical protein